MKVKTLLALAATCVTEDDAQNLLYALKDAFSKTSALGHLPAANLDASMEGDTPFVRYELNNVLSDQFILMIQPEIRDEKLCVAVCLNHMKDGLGMQSQDWELFLDLETCLDAEPDETIAALAKRVKEVALDHHAELLTSVGLKRAPAKRAAAQSW